MGGSKGPQALRAAQPFRAWRFQGSTWWNPTSMEGHTFHARVAFPDGTTPLRVLFRPPEPGQSLDEGWVIESVVPIDVEDDEVRLDFDIRVVPANL